MQVKRQGFLLATAHVVSTVRTNVYGHTDTTGHYHANRNRNGTHKMGFYFYFYFAFYFFEAFYYYVLL